MSWPVRRRILVTGASGLIGSELCGQLVERGHAVIALVHRLASKATELLPAVK
jgi:uncharacterized protein YbjT (DUF2867 family)